MENDSIWLCYMIIINSIQKWFKENWSMENTIMYNFDSILFKKGNNANRWYFTLSIYATYTLILHKVSPM